jgi:hypothetical protein
LGGVSFLVLLLAGTLPGGRHGALSAPAAGSTLQGGQLVEIRWSGIPVAAREVELLLSVDGGRTFPLRLTEELAPRSGSFFWRVPSLLSDEACLALRIGIDGKETLTVRGATFRLRPDPTPGKAVVRWKSGEIWLGTDEESEETEGLTPLPPDGLCAEPERLRAMPRDAAAGFPAPFPGVGFSRRSPQLLQTPARGPAETIRPAPASRTPLTTPQRI